MLSWYIETRCAIPSSQLYWYIYNKAPFLPRIPLPHLSINVHLLGLYLMHRDILANLLFPDDLLIQHRRRASGEHVALHLRGPLVRLHKAPLQRRLVLGDDRHVDVRARSQVVEDTGLDRVRGQRHGLLLREVRFPLRLEHGHGCERTAAHGHVRQLVRATVRVHGEEAHARGIHAGHHQVRPDVALVSEEVLLEHGHACHDAGLAACGEGVQLQLRGDERGGEFGIGCGSGSGAPDLGGDIVKLLAVLEGGLTRCPGSHRVEDGCTLSATIGPLVALVSAAIY